MPDKANAQFEGHSNPDASASYEFYLNEASGINFEHLARFCQPMLELFDVEPHHWRLPRTVPTDTQLLDAYTSALAAAEMFWSYFTLDESVRKRFLPELKSYFIGASPQPHEEADFLLLVDCMRTEWQKLSEDVTIETRAGVSASAVEDADVPDLETLALFGEPLMDNPDLLEDPDQLDEVMTLIHDFWNLARAGAADFERLLGELLERHTSTRNQRADLQRQAEKMVERYQELFIDGQNGRDHK